VQWGSSDQRGHQTPVLHRGDFGGGHATLWELCTCRGKERYCFSCALASGPCTRWAKGGDFTQELLGLRAADVIMHKHPGPTVSCVPLERLRACRGLSWWAGTRTGGTSITAALGNRPSEPWLVLGGKHLPNDHSVYTQSWVESDSEGQRCYLIAKTVGHWWRMCCSAVLLQSCWF
jgi:hypothetical protein